MVLSKSDTQCVAWVMSNNTVSSYPCTNEWKRSMLQKKSQKLGKPTEQTHAEDYYIKRYGRLLQHDYNSNTFSRENQCLCPAGAHLKHYYCELPRWPLGVLRPSAWNQDVINKSSVTVRHTDRAGTRWNMEQRGPSLMDITETAPLRSAETSVRTSSTTYE